MRPSTATTMDERRLRTLDLKATNFYVYMSVSAAAVAFLGFAPTYWAPLMTGAFKGHPVIHLHAAVFFSWTLLDRVAPDAGHGRRFVRHCDDDLRLFDVRTSRHFSGEARAGRGRRGETATHGKQETRAVAPASAGLQMDAAIEITGWRPT
jgi:hypothetical protein